MYKARSSFDFRPRGDTEGERDTHTKKGFSEKMERKVMVACSVAGFLGMLSVALGFAAEAKRIKSSQVSVDIKTGVCHYPRSPACGLGFASAMSLLVAHIIVNALTGCICCRRSSPSSSSRFHWALPLVCFVVSWFTFVLAFLSLLGGAILNDEHSTDNYYYCYVVKPGVFAGAALLALVSITLGITSYFSSAPGKNTNNQLVCPGPNHSGIAMGQAQIPPISQDPVFVHEDTYVGRQFT